MTNFIIKDDLFFTLEKSEGNTDFPRCFYARKISGSEIKIQHTENNSSLVDVWNIKDFTINGAVFTDVFLAINELQPILWNAASTSSEPLIPFVTSVIALQTPTGELVYLTNYSDGTSTYTNADGYVYAGDTTLLLPYARTGEKELILPISNFTESGSYEYFLPKSVHGINIINSVEIGTGVDTLSAISNYTIAPNGDLTIQTNAQFTTEIVRLTGNF